MTSEGERYQLPSAINTKELPQQSLFSQNTKFIVQPILHEYLSPVEDSSTLRLDLASTAQTELLLMQQDPSSEAYRILLHQLAFNWTATLLTSHHNPEIVALYQLSDEAYGVGAIMSLVPAYWKKHFIAHGNENPVAPHILSQQSKPRNL